MCLHKLQAFKFPPTTTFLNKIYIWTKHWPKWLLVWEGLCSTRHYAQRLNHVMMHIDKKCLLKQWILQCTMLMHQCMFLIIVTWNIHILTSIYVAFKRLFDEFYRCLVYFCTWMPHVKLLLLLYCLSLKCLCNMTAFKYLRFSQIIFLKN